MNSTGKLKMKGLEVEKHMEYRKKAINLAVALTAAAGTDPRQSAAKVAASISTSEYFTVSQVISLQNKEQVEVAVTKNLCDYIIIQEKLGVDLIGAGTIEQWRNKNKSVRIILIVDSEKKSGRKAESLYDKGYYDAIFSNDFSKELLIPIMLQSRAKEDAYVYYGIKREEPDVITLPNNPDNSAESVQKERVAEQVQVKELSEQYKSEIPIGESGAVESVTGPTTIDSVQIDTRMESVAMQHSVQEIKQDSPTVDGLENMSHAAGVGNAGQQAVESSYVQQQMEQERMPVYSPDNIMDLPNFQPTDKTPDSSGFTRVNTKKGDVINSDFAKKNTQESLQGGMSVKSFQSENTSNSQYQQPQGQQIKKLSEEYYDEDFREDAYPSGQGMMQRSSVRGINTTSIPHRMPPAANGRTPFEPSFSGGRSMRLPAMREIPINPTVVPYDGYVIKPISDTVILVEVPDAHFMTDVNAQQGAIINLITNKE